jgi:hypothetical protein
MHQRKTFLGTLVILAICLSGAQLTAQAKAGKAPQVPPVNFAAPVNYTVGSLPFANSVGDFNGDHILDIAVCNYNSNNVSVLLGNGDGTFKAAVNYAVGTEPSAITVADLNHDGYPDIAVADEIGKTIAVLINNADGTGTFKPAVLYPAGQAPRGIVAGDLRNIGILDLVVANNLGGDATVFLGNGDGTFQAGVNYAADVNPKSVALGDFSGDGILDIAVANHNTNDVSILMGNGDGTFKPPVNYAVGLDPRFVAVADFNLDGKLDLVTANGGASTISILYGNGDGTFQPQITYVVNNTPVASPRWAAVADYNNDGIPDVATSNYDADTVSVLLGTGQTAAGTGFLPAINYNVGKQPTGIVAGDFNGDGKPDLSVTIGGLPTAPNTIMSIMLNNPVVVSPTTLTFPIQVQGTSSTSQAVTLTNSAPNTLTISSIAITGTNLKDFTQTNTCGSALSGNSSCTINVTFTPTGINNRVATLTIADSAPGGAQAVALAGVGTAAALSPTSLTFASQAVGTTSAQQTITLTDVSGTTMTISSIAVTGTNSTDFAQSNNCGSSLAGKSSCTITVTFTPTATGTRTAAITVTDNAGGTSQSVTLTGTGTPAAVSLSPTALTFPLQVLGTSSTPQTVTLSNTSSTAITITTIAITGTSLKDFSQTNNCGSSLAANSSCTINVTFKPTSANTRNAVLSVTDNASNSPQTATLQGICTAVSLSPTSLTFAAQTVGTTSGAQAITLTNTSGVGTLNISKLSITGTNPGDFAETTNCLPSVPAKGTCTINVTFKPTATGARSASVSIADNGGGSPQTVPLTGTGQ